MIGFNAGGTIGVTVGLLVQKHRDMYLTDLHTPQGRDTGHRGQGVM